MIKTFLLVVFIFVQSISFGQKNSVEAALEKLRVAMVSGNPEALKSITHQNLTYGHSSGLIENQQTFIEAFVSGNSKFTNLNFSDIQIIQTGKTCIIRHILEGGTHNLGKEPAPIKLKVMLVFEMHKKEWLLLARQAIKF